MFNLEFINSTIINTVCFTSLIGLYHYFFNLNTYNDINSLRSEINKLNTDLSYNKNKQNIQIQNIFKNINLIENNIIALQQNINNYDQFITFQDLKIYVTKINNKISEIQSLIPTNTIDNITFNTSMEDINNKVSELQSLIPTNTIDNITFNTSMEDINNKVSELQSLIPSNTVDNKKDDNKIIDTQFIVPENYDELSNSIFNLTEFVLSDNNMDRLSNYTQLKYPNLFDELNKFYTCKTLNSIIEKKYGSKKTHLIISLIKETKLNNLSFEQFIEQYKFNHILENNQTYDKLKNEWNNITTNHFY